MAVTVTCGSCGVKLRAPVVAEGRVVKCPRCGAKLRVQSPSKPPPPSPSPSPSAPGPVATTTRPAPQPPSPAPHRQPPPPLASPPPEPHRRPPPAGDLPPTSPPTMAGERRFVPYLSDPSLLDDPSESATSAAGSDDATNAADAAAEGSSGARGPRPLRAPVAWAKALILSAAVVFIGICAWYGVERYVGRKNWVVNYSVLAGLIGMGTASAMIGTHRSGAAAKLAAAVSALSAVALAKALILCAGELPPDLLRQPDLTDRLAALAGLAFKPIDALFAAMALIGSTVRFILSEPEE